MIAAGHYLVKILLASPQLLGLVLVRIHVGGGWLHCSSAATVQSVCSRG